MCMHFLEDAAAISPFTIYDNSILLELACLMNEWKTNVSGLSE